MLLSSKLLSQVLSSLLSTPLPCQPLGEHRHFLRLEVARQLPNVIMMVSNTFQIKELSVCEIMWFEIKT